MRSFHGSFQIMFSPLSLPDELQHLVWRADASVRLAEASACPSGHAALDAELPAGGWPAAGAIELLQPPRVHAEWALLAPALSQWLRQREGPCVLVRPEPPECAPGRMPGLVPGLMPFAPGLQALGLPTQRLLWVGAAQPEAQLWACEQALQCADTVAVLAWLQRVRSDDLRRLHRTASSHGKPLFVMRSDAQALQPSPVPLRVQLLQAWPLRLRVLKRRGAPSHQVLELPRTEARLGLRRLPAPVTSPLVRPMPLRPGARHALDRPVAA